ncbi:MAG: NAD(P)-dependent oxidoreductase [Terriglobia bacterium]
MRVFVAGATGAIGRRLVPMLVADGHSVTGMTRSPGKCADLEKSGAAAVVADALDAHAVADAVRRAQPEVIIHELTAIPAAFDIRKLEQQFHLTSLLRTEGTDNLLAAARASGVRRFIAQSYAGWYARTGGAVKAESDPLDTNPPAAVRETLHAIGHLEAAVQNTAGMDGIVLRYGSLYGPGNGLSEGGPTVEQVRRRKFPVVGAGTGVWSFIHVDDAARATLLAVTRGAAGVYNIVDDDPAPVSQWLPALAEIVGGKPPLRLPAWLARFAVGETGVLMMTQARGASNRKAKTELNWQLVWPSWRQGFNRGLGDTVSTRNSSQPAAS